MVRRKRDRDVVYVERGGDASVRWLLWGAALGAGLALLYAPRSGEETRRLLQRRMWKLRAMTEEKLDELVQQFGDRQESWQDFEEDEELDFPVEANGSARRQPSSAREEIERRLADARARRRASAETEEPLA